MWRSLGRASAAVVPVWLTLCRRQAVLAHMDKLRAARAAEDEAARAFSEVTATPLPHTVYCFVRRALIGVRCRLQKAWQVLHTGGATTLGEVTPCLFSSLAVLGLTSAPLSCVMLLS